MFKSKEHTKNFTDVAAANGTWANERLQAMENSINALSDKLEQMDAGHISSLQEEYESKHKAAWSNFYEKEKFENHNTHYAYDEYSCELFQKELRDLEEKKNQAVLRQNVLRHPKKQVSNSLGETTVFPTQLNKDEIEYVQRYKTKAHLTNKDRELIERVLENGVSSSREFDISGLSMMYTYVEDDLNSDVRIQSSMKQQNLDVMYVPYVGRLKEDAHKDRHGTAYDSDMGKSPWNIALSQHKGLSRSFSRLRSVCREKDIDLNVEFLNERQYDETAGQYCTAVSLSVQTWKQNEHKNIFRKALKSVFA